jgi:outer membrane immunogenic protein
MPGNYKYMKKIVLISAICLLSTVASMAQSRVGGILGYGSEVDRWGLGINGEFMVSDRIGLSPSLFFYFPEKTAGLKYSYWELNGNVHYYFFKQDVLNLYGLAGLNLTTVNIKRDRDFLDNTKTGSHSEAGLNLGVGSHLDLGSALPFAELKYVAGDIDQVVLWLGVKFPLRRDID